MGEKLIRSGVGKVYLELGTRYPLNRDFRFQISDFK